VAVCVKHEIPIIISSLRAPPKEMLDAIHAYGGIVMHDVISIRHAEKALEAGVDGLILVASGAGGHAGALSPFALVGEVRKFFKGPIALAGSIATGDGVLAAQAMGADFAYIGSRWLATPESNVDQAYRDAIIESTAADVVYTNLFTGVHGNYLKKSIVQAGLDPDNLPVADKTKMNFGSGSGGAKAWKDIWGAGQGVGLMDDAPSVAEVVTRLEAEYQAARARLGLSV
jgi:nitronate monooxygenase